MFWTSELFVKRKGKFGWIWIAGTSFRRVPPRIIKESDVPELCNSLQNSEVPLALRMQGILMHGITRMHNKKAYFYMTRALGFKSAARKAGKNKTGSVDMPIKRRKAQHRRAITLPEADISIALDADDAFEEALLLVVSRAGNMVGAKNGQRSFAADQLGDFGIDFEALEARSRAGPSIDLDIGSMHSSTQVGHGGASSLSYRSMLDDDLGVAPLGSIDGALDFDSHQGGIRANEQKNALVFDEVQVHEAFDGRAPPENKSVKSQDSTPEKVSRTRKRKRKKRRLPRSTPDAVIELSNAQIREQLRDTSDIVHEKMPMFQYPTAKRRKLQKRALEESLSLPYLADMAPELIKFHKSLLVAPKLGQEEKERELRHAEHPMRDDQHLHRDDFDEPFVAPPRAPVAGGSSRSISASGGGISGAFSESDIEYARASAGSYSRRRSSLLPRRSFFGVRVTSDPGSESDTSARRVPFEDAFDSRDEQTPFPQFSIPEEHNIVQKSRVINRSFSQLTKIFLRVLDDAFEEMLLQGDGTRVGLRDLLNANAAARRLDLSAVAQCFFQLLVLRNLDVVHTDQPIPFGEIWITKGPKWGLSLSQV